MLKAENCSYVLFLTRFLCFGFFRFTARGWEPWGEKKGGAIMGDKGRKDKNKHDKQVDKAKNTKNEANRKKQEKTH